MKQFVDKEALRTAMRSTGALSDHIEFFMSRIDRYPFTAQAPIAIKPPIVPGEHMSVRLRSGWRIWGFETEKERDTFIVQFNAQSFPEN